MQYYLISKKTIDNINSNVVSLFKVAKIMKDDDDETFSDEVMMYSLEIGELVNNSIECNVIPRNTEGDDK